MKLNHRKNMKRWCHSLVVHSYNSRNTSSSACWMHTKLDTHTQSKTRLPHIPHRHDTYTRHSFQLPHRASHDTPTHTPHAHRSPYLHALKGQSITSKGSCHKFWQDIVNFCIYGSHSWDKNQTLFKLSETLSTYSLMFWYILSLMFQWASSSEERIVLRRLANRLRHSFFCELRENCAWHS